MTGDRDVTITTTPMAAIRDGTAFTRTTVAVVLVTFSALILSPTAAAARQTLASPASLTGAKAAPAKPDRLNDALKEARAILQRMQGAAATGAVPAPEIKQLAALKSQLIEGDREVLAAFAEDLAHIKKHKLPDVIVERHAQALSQYKSKHAEMMKRLDAVAASKGAAGLKGAVQEALGWLGKQQLEMAPAPFDPNKLGFQVETKRARAPKLTAKELKAIAPLRMSFKEGEKSIEVATAGSMSGLLAASAVTPPGPEYLAPTIDVQITPEIQALAAQLNNNPVEIYNWVRNNIDWIPTYGSVQGSQLTLDKKAGNAFDTASLLIALLRAANVPARYAYGTIQVPIAQAMNWAGGFTHPDAAQTFLATGGIPNNAFTSGGVTKFIQMEHIWVEAFVDFYPSRGARNLAPDTWVPMDAAYKPYTYTDGLDVQGEVPFDADGFLTAAQSGATVNEQEGWVQNLNQANIQTRLTQYQAQLQDFVEQQSPDAAVGEVLGAKTIQPSNAPMLAANLPYKLVATGNRYAALPDSLRHKFQYSLYANSYERSIENPLWTYVEATPNLASKKVTLSFVPASDADRQTIESYLPKPHADGSPIQPEEFPSSLPAYDIRVTAELRVEGNVVATGGTFALGTELVGEGGFTYLHNLSDWDLTQERHVAGQTSGMGLSLQGISASQILGLKDRVAALKEELARGVPITSSAESVAADLTNAVMWSYFAEVETASQHARTQSAVTEIPGLSYGFFHAAVQPEFRYGLITRARFPGVQMDVGHLRRVAFSNTNNVEEFVLHNRNRGKHASSSEHELPERFQGALFSQEATSAVKALAVAAAQGQRVYTINTQNQDQLSSIQQSPAVMANIRAAVAAGKEVQIHEHPISYSGFVGAGYIIVDPATGAGSYLIEGGRMARSWPGISRSGSASISTS